MAEKMVAEEIDEKNECLLCLQEGGLMLRHDSCRKFGGPTSRIPAKHLEGHIMVRDVFDLSRGFVKGPGPLITRGE